MMKLVPRESIDIMKNSEYLYVPVRSIKSILILCDTINDLLKNYAVSLKFIESKYLYMITNKTSKNILLLEYNDKYKEFNRTEDLIISILNGENKFLSNLEYILIKLRLDDAREILNSLFNHNNGVDITISHDIVVCILEKCKKICLHCNRYLEKYYEYDNIDIFLKLFKRRG